MQIVEYSEAVDLTMHGMHDDIYVMQPMAISGMTMQEVRAAAEAGAVFAVMKQPQTKAEEKPEKEPEQKAEAKPTPPPKSPVGQGRKRKLDTGKMTALRNAGWSYEKIADEMGCSAGTVWNNFNKDKEDKKDVSENQ
ncbi:MAG: helix-turn-helix domain-containing protein [Lachnospiraceae bacterium]|nr:helix-turn-helix domain-containing protein [Lachnospiraceae bacterium]